MPIVSAVIPCYNHGEYIDRAVDSVLNQTIKDIEIIIVNDGSTDDYSKEKLKNYNKPKTKVLHTDNNGPSAARNIGISHANGMYVLALDADDYFLPTFLEKAVVVFEQQANVGVVACGIQQFGLDSSRKMPRGGDVRSFLTPSGLAGSALLRKICWEQIGGYNESMKTAGYEDWNFWLDITKRGWIVHVIDEYLFCYNWQNGSRRTKLNKQREESLAHVIRNHIDVFGKYVDLVILHKDAEVVAMRKQRDILASSLEYRTGKKILRPIRFLQQQITKEYKYQNNSFIKLIFRIIACIKNKSIYTVYIFICDHIRDKI
ncbi:glycosyltransferase family 2 protein [Candidatus Electronema sp. TJ]|uniref:glycosyltransferase family 2 protein n=1 Tax=Candidatus Electronema sp. TJ TaxID=3401573 RepID=UPI003AA8F360